jgi:hypothetical protein
MREREMQISQDPPAETARRPRILALPGRPLRVANDNLDAAVRPVPLGAAAPALHRALTVLALETTLRSPGLALARLKPLVAAERARLTELAKAAPVRYGADLARLLDSAVSGLLALGRAYVRSGGWAEPAPVAAVALGHYAQGTLAHGALPELLLLVPEEAEPARGRGERMAAFATIGFADLGLAIRCTVASAAEHAARAAHCPGTPRSARFVWGNHDLYARLEEARSSPPSRPGADAAGSAVPLPAAAQPH